MTVVATKGTTAGFSGEEHVRWLQRLLGADFLLWSPNIQAEGFLHWDEIFATRVVKAPATPTPLPRAAREIDITFDDNGRTCTIDDLFVDEHLSGLLVLKDGEIVLERYALGLSPEGRWQSSSMVKSITSTLIGAAIHDGLIPDIDTPAKTFVPELADTAYDDVTIKHLLQMSSGVSWTEDYEDLRADVAEGYIKPIAERRAGSILAHLLTATKLFSPGTHYYYNTGDTFLLSLILSRATGTTVSDYASEKLWKPLGMEQDGYFMLESDDGQEITGSCCGAGLRDYGRFGLFMANDGVAGDVRILPEGWVAEATAPSAPEFHYDWGTRPHLDVSSYTGYGYLWWVPEPGAFEALGAYGQWIYVVPGEGLVFVLIGAMPRPGYMHPDEPAAKEPGSEHGGSRRLGFIRAVRDSFI